ncbi:hypothetical protein [Nocardia wallacei]|uniref:hypothetical protein n=1 Tax=Nocardia wallacei TaxID=480035 RepID=UPI002455A53A|nr:hypothetical protein [Nocardia wallacei]
MSEPLVVLLRELHTDMGIFTQGQAFPATRTPNGWLVHLLERRGPDHSVLLPADEVEVRASAREMTRDWVLVEYWWARRKLGHTHAAAVAWLLERYALSLIQLRRLGIDEYSAPEVAA